MALAREDGVAALVTTHHMAEAEHCDRVALMFAGRLVADASPADLTETLQCERGQPWELAIDDPSNALARLRAAGFEDASVVGPHVRVTLREPARDVARVEALLTGLGVRRIEPRPVTLEDVFVARATSIERATVGSGSPA